MNLKELVALKYKKHELYKVNKSLPLGAFMPFKRWNGNTIGVTRSSVAINPLSGYNVSTGNVMTQFANGVQATHGGYGYVGGDTTELTFDFGTKVAGSVVECPMKFYYSTASTLQPPTNTTGSITGETVPFSTWIDNQQTWLDKFKSQEGNTQTLSTNVSGNITQFMIELDLTPVCNQLFGGSNSALKSALKYINVDMWTMGSGSNGGVTTNGVTANIWTQSAWAGNWQNSTGSIAKVSGNSTDMSNKLDGSNKIYYLVNANYPSNGTIASSISLDYAKITIGLNRTVDTVTSKPIVLPKYWAMLVKGFSPSWDSTNAIDKFLFHIRTNAIPGNFVQFKKVGQNYRLVHVVDSVTEGVNSSAISNSKYQVHSILAMQLSNSIVFKVLKNNGTVETYSLATTKNLEGSSTMFLLGNDANSQQIDSFAESFNLYDLQVLGKSSGFTDYEAESILRGDGKYYITTTSDYVGKVAGSVVENPNISKWNYATSLQTPSSFTNEIGQTRYGNINILDGTSYPNSTTTNTMMAQTLFSFDLISIVERKYGTIPNCSTVADKVVWLKANINKMYCNWYGYGSCPSGNKAYLALRRNNENDWANNSTIITTSSPSQINYAILATNATATPINTIDSNGFVHFLAYSDASNGTIASTIYTDYISLDVTVKTGNTSVYVPQKELFDINAVTVNFYATRNNGVITLNATGSYQESTLYIPVLPNNQYTISGNVTGANGYIAVREYLNNSVILKSLSGLTPSTTTATFTTGSTTNYIRVLLGSSSAGTFTFSNISFKIKM